MNTDIRAIYLDLGDTYDVTKCELYLPVKDFDTGANINSYDVVFYGSEDGVEYFEIGNGTYSEVNSVSAVQAVDCNVKARYIEARMSQWGWIFVSEIAVNGELSNNDNIPENSQPEESEPEISKPETSKPEVSEPDVSVPETSNPDVSEPDVSIPDIMDDPELPESDEDKTKKSGDINDNGKIDMTDYILLKRAYFGTYDFTEMQYNRGDINGNGNIDMTDYILLKRAYFGTYTIK